MVRQLECSSRGCRLIQTIIVQALDLLVACESARWLLPLVFQPNPAGWDDLTLGACAEHAAQVPSVDTSRSLETDIAVIPLFMQWSDKTTVEVLASGAENDAPLSVLLALHWRKYDTLMQAMLRCTSLESNQVRTRSQTIFCSSKTSFP